MRVKSAMVVYRANQLSGNLQEVRLWAVCFLVLWAGMLCSRDRVAFPLRIPAPLSGGTASGGGYRRLSLRYATSGTRTLQRDRDSE